MAKHGPVPRVIGTAGKLAVSEEIEPPDWLSSEGLAEWHRIVPTLQNLGVICALDAAVVAIYCSTAGWLAVCEQRLRYEFEAAGMDSLVRASERSGMERVAVLHQLARSLRADLLRFGTELGLTPVGRARLHLAQPDRPGASPFSGLLYGEDGRN